LANRIGDATKRGVVFPDGISFDAESNGEVPIGAVLVSDGKVIGKSGNQTITLCDATAHAEMVAIREACQFIGNHRLSNSTLYVTLEPCSMCAGAIIQARIPRVVYAALDHKAGAVKSNFQLLNDERLNHQCEVHQGLYEEHASKLLSDFFKQRR